MTSLCVNLTPEEALAAGVSAIVHQIRATTHNRKADHGSRSGRSQRERWADAIHGIMAEYAVAKALNKAWTSGGVYPTSGDIGENIEVRATEYGNGHLIVYKHESDSAIFILVTGHFPTFVLRGWITGRDAKNMKWWDGHKDPPCFWIPQDELKPIEELIAIVD